MHHAGKISFDPIYIYASLPGNMSSLRCLFKLTLR